jgi:hypothetical protein
LQDWDREYLIPLPADSAFFQLLTDALQNLSTNLTTVRSKFMISLEELSDSISSTARPVSETDRATFHAHSHLADAANVHVSIPSSSALIAPARHHKSDLYTWREIFQLYVDAEIFQGLGEHDRGDRSVEEAEERLNKFTERLNQTGVGLGRNLALKESKAALQAFMQLNLDLLNIKKVCLRFGSANIAYALTLYK